MLASPAYVALMSRVPVAVIVTDSVAVLPPFTVAEPSRVVPSKNLTLPVGAVAPVVVTTAVNVTFLPALTGFGEADSVVVVAAFATASAAPGDAGGSVSAIARRAAAATTAPTIHARLRT